MSDMNHTWYFEDGSCITGEAADRYLQRKVQLFRNISERISTSLSQISEYNHLLDSGDLCQDVMENGENLSLIQIELEMLMRDVCSVLEN